MVERRPDEQCGAGGATGENGTCINVQPLDGHTGDRQNSVRADVEREDLPRRTADGSPAAWRTCGWAADRGSRPSGRGSAGT